MIKKASRQLALGIGTSALKLAKTMNLLAGEIDSRVSGNIKEITAAEMRAYIQSGANLIEKSTKALKVAMELERIEEKQMLAGMNGQEEEEMTPEDALETLANLREVGDLIDMADDKE
jgi:endo-alpha-1,4-polygalactosaminidase (GH114 family)